MSQYTHWELIHKFNDVVRRGHVERLSCPVDRGDLVSRLDDRPDSDEDDITFWCYDCNSKYYLSADTWDSIQAVVQEWDTVDTGYEV